MAFAKDELEYFRGLGFSAPDIDFLEQHQQKGLKGLAGATPESAMALVTRLRECTEKYAPTWPVTPDLRTLILANLNTEAIEHLENTERMRKLIEDYRREILIPKIVKEEKTSASRNAAIATHAYTNEQKRKAITYWDTKKSEYSSISGFARNKCKQYGVKERTLTLWISQHEKQKTRTAKQLD